MTMIEALKQKSELYDLFTRQEEYNCTLLDMYQRFPYCLSRHRSILEPEVSKFLIEIGLKVDYPHDKEFAVCLTHDIDSIYSKVSLSRTAKSLVCGQINDALITSLNKKYKKWNPLWNFKNIMALEDEYNAKSSFFFLALNKEDLDFNFYIEDLENEIGNVADMGWEVGLHGGHEAYNNLNDIKEQKQKLEKVLGQKVIGYRNHFLRFNVPDTWELLSEAGFRYDTTLGYADCVGFRNGMCHPFKPFNLNTNRGIDILEIPLTIMDCTLFDYMRLDLKEAWKLTKTLIDTVEKYKGTITILWHNTYMRNDKLRFYEKILQYCSEKNAWMTSGEEIYKWNM